MKGMVATIVREMPAYAGQFGGYFLTKRLWATHVERCDVDKVGTLGCFIAGGVGGFSCWFYSYPQDVIKTRLQVARSSEYGKFKGFIPDGGVINCARAIYREEGHKGFWRGFVPCTIRAVIANSFMFASYELA